MAFNVVVDEEKCAGCEECVDVCPVEVFEMKDDMAAKAVSRFVKKARLP
jgi:Fe-S-cluster-containing hydrogenase component 2